MSRKIDDIKHRLGVQLVIDGVKRTRDNPSFLDSRDGILHALSDMRDSNQLTNAQYGSARTIIWRVFAKYGMGPNAQSNGAQSSGIVADFNVPAGIFSQADKIINAKDVNEMSSMPSLHYSNEELERLVDDTLGKVTEAIIEINKTVVLNPCSVILFRHTFVSHSELSSSFTNNSKLEVGKC